jgi:hypothetical protein
VDTCILGLLSGTRALEYSMTLAQVYSSPALKGFGILVSSLGGSSPTSTCISSRANLNQVCHHITVIIQLKNPPRSDSGHHLPDLTDFKEVVSLLCLLNVATLGHLIYLPFYQEKVNLFDSSHQSLFSVTRQKAEAILGYMDRNVLFRKDGVELEFKPLFQTYFVQQVRSLIHQCSSRQPEDRPIIQGENPIFQRLTGAVAASFYSKKWFVKEMGRQRKINYPDTSYAWISDEVFVTSLAVRNACSEGLCGSSHMISFLITLLQIF